MKIYLLKTVGPSCKHRDQAGSPWEKRKCDDCISMMMNKYNHLQHRLSVYQRLIEFQDLISARKLEIFSLQIKISI